jgi:hypothetical protein
MAACASASGAAVRMSSASATFSACVVPRAILAAAGVCAAAYALPGPAASSTVAAQWATLEEKAILTLDLV